MSHPNPRSKGSIKHVAGLRLVLTQCSPVLVQYACAAFLSGTTGRLAAWTRTIPPPPDPFVPQKPRANSQQLYSPPHPSPRSTHAPPTHRPYRQRRYLPRTHGRLPQPQRRGRACRRLRHPRGSRPVLRRRRRRRPQRRLHRRRRPSRPRRRGGGRHRHHPRPARQQRHPGGQGGQACPHREAHGLLRPGGARHGRRLRRRRRHLHGRADAALPPPLPEREAHHRVRRDRRHLGLPRR